MILGWTNPHLNRPISQGKAVLRREQEVTGAVVAVLGAGELHAAQDQRAVAVSRVIALADFQVVVQPVVVSVCNSRVCAIEVLPAVWQAIAVIVLIGIGDTVLVSV